MVLKISAAAIVASFALMGAASAAAISTEFDFVPFGVLTSNTGNITTATSITSGAPLEVTTILTDNTGLAPTDSVSLTSPMPLTVGSAFTKSWTTALGTFTAALTVTSRTTGATSLGIDATGTVTETTVISGPALSPSPDFYSAAYTQNAGPGTQINASFNNSTTPPAIPEPASLALLGVGLLGLGFLTAKRRN
jgi:purine-cytosine permease-like protein